MASVIQIQDGPNKVNRVLFDVGMKIASDSHFGTIAYNLAGMFYVREFKGRHWGLLNIPNALVHGVFKAMSEPGIELPPANDGGQFDAHLTIFRPEEIEAIGGPDKLKPDRGKQFKYTLGRLVSFQPRGWAEMSKAWVLRVHSPELQTLRRSYGLSSLPNEGDYDFHISVAVRKSNVRGYNKVSKTAAVTGVDKAVLTFALNLEYMEVAYYEGLLNMGYTKNHDGAGLMWLMHEILENEKGHVKFLEDQLGDDAPEKPEIDINALKGLAKEAGIDDFDPYANWKNLLLGGMIIEDVGVTAYAGACTVVEDPDVRTAVAGILSTEAHHMGMVRSFLYYKFHADDVVDKITAVKRKISGLEFDQPIRGKDGIANFVPSDDDGIGFARTPRQVLDMVFAKKGAMKGGLFPQGFNGDFSVLLGD